MPSSIKQTSLGSEFDAFLFAPVGEDDKQMLVSVVSALARLNMDPWEEARTLSLLSGKAATTRLSSLAALMSGTVSETLDAGSIEERLAKLLPTQEKPPVCTAENIDPDRTAADAKDTRTIMAINIIILLVLIGVQVLISSYPSGLQADGSAAPPTPIGSHIRPLVAGGR